MNTKLLITLAAAALPFAAAPNPIQEWPVPWENSRPRDPYVAPNGLVWFVGQEGNYVANLDPKTGKFDRYEIDPGTHPHNLVVAPDGMVWYTGNQNARLVKLDPKTRKLTTYPMPDPAIQDPHTMTFDKSGNIWFTAQGAAVIGRRDAKSGEIRVWKMPQGSRPYGIELDADQRPWVDLFGTNAIETIDPTTMKERRYELPDGARPRRIAVTKDGIFYGDYARGFLGRLDPATGKVTEFKLPAGAASLPYAMTHDDKGKVWVAETGVMPNRLVGFDPRVGRFTDTVATEGGNGANTIRHMVFYAPKREIWYGTDRNTVGRLEVP